MNILNNEVIIVNIFTNFSPSTIRKLRLINKLTYKIYNDEYFYKQYCNKNYFIITKHKSHSWKYITFYCESLTNKLFSRNIFLSYRTLQAIILITGYHIIKTSYFSKNYDIYKNSIISIPVLSDLINKFLSEELNKSSNTIHYGDFYKLYKLNNLTIFNISHFNNTYVFDAIEDSLSEYSTWELQSVSKILNLINRPTTYLVPSINDRTHLQHYTINYDMDLNEFYNIDILFNLLTNNNKLKIIQYFSEFMA